MLSPKRLEERLAQAPILLAAIEVFGRLGFDATRVEDLLEAAGIARRTFYKHFGNKEEVLASIYELATSELLATIGAALGSGGDPLVAIVRALDGYLDYHVANPRLVAVLVQQAIRFDSPLAPLRQRFRDRLVVLLDEAVRAGAGPRHDPLLYAALISALEGLSLELVATRPGALEIGRAKRVMRQLVERALALPAPRRRRR